MTVSTLQYEEPRDFLTNLGSDTNVTLGYGI